METVFVTDGYRRYATLELELAAIRAEVKASGEKRCTSDLGWLTESLAMWPLVDYGPFAPTRPDSARGGALRLNTRVLMVTSRDTAEIAKLGQQVPEHTKRVWPHSALTP